MGTVSKDVIGNIISCMNDALVLADIDYSGPEPRAIICFVNESACKMLGYKDEELIGKDMDAFSHANAPSCPEWHDDLLEKSFVSDLEATLSSKSGKKIPVILFLSVLKGQQGEATKVICIAHDITGRKRAEQELRKSVSLLKATTDATADGIMVVDLHDQLAFINNQFKTMMGMPEHLLNSWNMDQMMAFFLEKVKAPEVFLKSIRKSVDKPGKLFMDTVELLDGRILEMHMRPQKVDEKIIGHVISLRDITEREKLIRDLEYRRKFKELIVHLSTNFINMPAEEIGGKISDALRQIGEFAGVDRTMIVQYRQQDNCFHMLYEWAASEVGPHPDQAKCVDAALLDQWISNISEKDNVYYPRIDEASGIDEKTREYLQALDIKSVVAVKMSQRERDVGFIIFESIRREKKFDSDVINLLKIVAQIFLNALEHQRTQKALRELNEQLEQRVEQRTRELRNKQVQLAQTEKMASLGHLVAGVAHEINTPLGAINSNNDIFIRAVTRIKNILKEELGEQGIGKRLRELFGSIEELSEISTQASGRIVKIVNSLRTFARIDQAEKDTVDIHEGLEITLTLVHHELKNRIAVHRDYGEIPPVTCYPNRLNQVYMNLLMNASQAIGGKGDIFIRTFIEDGQAVLEIRDTGHGIPHDKLRLIFDPGYTTKGVGVGTGLGLSIVYQIVQEHHGRIEVESEPGQGCLFRIILPLDS